MADEEELAPVECVETEPGSALEEPAVAWSDIEAEEDSDGWHSDEPDEAADIEGEIVGAICPVRMGRSDCDPQCGRGLHVAAQGVDDEPVCLMHSKDPNKQSGPLFDLFLSEFVKSLEEAGEGVAHFERVVFPNLDLTRWSFQATCSFRYALFTRDARFSQATFNRNADFLGAIFSQDAKFYKAEFKQQANFSKVTILRNANFSDATFAGDSTFRQATFRGHAGLSHAAFKKTANFNRTTFMQGADFADAVLAGNAYFNWARFEGYAFFLRAAFETNADFHRAAFAKHGNFSRTTFMKRASFFESRFMQNANFSRSTFAEGARFAESNFTLDANFIKATFTQNASFADATFARDGKFQRAAFVQNADFSKTTFTGVANFGETRFNGSAYWTDGNFLGTAEFRRTKFHVREPGAPSAVFALVSFSKPQEVVFDDVDLSRALFHNCDVSEIWFTSSVRWGERENGGAAVFDEEIPLDQDETRGLRRNGERDFRALAQIYQQLKKNYDSRLDYWTGNEFHFGEMEMKRLAGPTEGRLLWVRLLLHRRISPVALYRYTSDYGNSFWKPILYLLGTLVLFGALLPLPGVGVKRQGAKYAETYASVWQVGGQWSPNLWAEIRLAAKGEITSADTATFQRGAEYVPAYPWGQVLAIIETLLTSTAFALFLLAIRRQFRR